MATTTNVRHQRKLAKEVERRANAAVTSARRRGHLGSPRVQQEPEPEPEPARPRLSLFSELDALGVRASRRHVDRMETNGEFPKRVPLSAGRVGWITAEIITWVDTRIASRVTQPGKLGSGFTRPRPPPVAPQPGSRRRSKPAEVEHA